MSRAFARGCPHRPYARFAQQGRPGYCPCAWTDFMVGVHLRRMVVALDPEWVRRLVWLDRFPD